VYGLERFGSRSTYSRTGSRAGVRLMMCLVLATAVRLGWVALRERAQREAVAEIRLQALRQTPLNPADVKENGVRVGEPTKDDRRKPALHTSVKFVSERLLRQAE
jgi:hypothetical protein